MQVIASGEEWAPERKGTPPSQICTHRKKSECPGLCSWGLPGQVYRPLCTIVGRKSRGLKTATYGSRRGSAAGEGTAYPEWDGAAG